MSHRGEIPGDPENFDLMRRLDDGRGPSTGLFALSALLLCVAIPGWIVTQTGGGGRHLEPYWPLLLAVLFGCRYSWVIACGRVALFEMSAWLFAYMFMGLAPLVQLRTKDVLDTTPFVQMNLMPQAAMIVLLGSCALMAGSWLAQRPPRSSGPREQSTAGATGFLNLTRLRLLCAVSWLANAYMIKTMGGPGILFKSRFEVSDAASQVFQQTFQSVMVASFANMTLLVAATGMVTHVRFTPKELLRPVDRWLAIGQTVLLLVTVNPISSARYVFGTALLALAGAYGAYEGLARFRTIAIAALMGFLVIFPLLDSFRVSTTGGLQEVDPISAMLSGDFDSFYEVINTVQYVNELGTTHGRQLLGVALFAVPRMLWPDKPVDTGILLAHFKGYRFTNLSAPLWAEMYINGGWIFLVLSMTLIGAGLRRADDAMHARITGAIPLTPLQLALPFYMLILMRGSLLQAAANLSVLMLSYLAVRSWPEVSRAWHYFRNTTPPGN